MLFFFLEIRILNWRCAIWLFLMRVARASFMMFIYTIVHSCLLGFLLLYTWLVCTNHDSSVEDQDDSSIGAPLILQISCVLYCEANVKALQRQTVERHSSSKSHRCGNSSENIATAARKPRRRDSVLFPVWWADVSCWLFHSLIIWVR